MKKFATLLLLFVYVAGITGVGVKGFYCCGKLASLSASIHEEPNKKAIEGDGCCKTKYQFHKIKDTHQHSDTAPVAFGQVAILPSFGHFAPELALSVHDLLAANRSNAPPPLPDIPLYLLHCTYRI
ncbi:hypothetical protein GA0116948_104200 [Chitinophaga costaii]|uniref:Uncharacterized protein n=1 Tax=Chitinophaga costaii TaxID=1335309 RepID=A0A1C4CMD9_9BACT|nr:hypothetical protein [Chitinophaga costaii]PUZ27029.1 hypothetical protein DCM91_07295 [Chitinophaga costaii]SCC20245.1 hypothetical protein GA0116948_104200 [Chitinophaga costaii]